LRIAFAGTPDFAADHLRALLGAAQQIVGVHTQPDRAAGRGKKPRPSPVKSLALEHELPVFQPRSLRDEAAQAELAELEADVLVVVAYGLILPQAVLDLPRFGCINVHGSLLPRWRGAAPIQRAIEAGDDRSGVTIMQMEAGLDTGPMLARRECPITPLTSSADLYARLAELGPKLLLEVLDDLPTFLERAEKQDDSLATYAHKIDKSEAELDWAQSAAVLARRVRAFDPAPGCYSLLGDQRVKVWAACARTGSHQAPGTIIRAEGNGITVACGEGSLELTRLQLPGARSMDAAEVLRGRAGIFEPGRQFSLPKTS
jgi:methionyl-tRNA formyltransferase